MPLDDTGRNFILEDDALARIGITSVPEDQVRQYKAVYKEYWLRLNCNYVASHRGPFEWKTASFATWKRCQQGRELKNFTVADFLAAPMKFCRTSDRTPAPRELVNLATIVEKNIADAQFSVDYFDTDPVLNVHWATATSTRHACLGIWDKGKIVAIADHLSIATVSPTGFLARLRHSLFAGGLWGR